MATTTLPRGLRNNNPLNLRISNNPWLGKVKNNTDGAFEQFTTIEYGYRAAFRNIRTIVQRRSAQDNTTTVRQLIHVWAPGSDGNNEAAYCQSVQKHSSINPDELVIIKNKEFMCKLVYGMAVTENGQAVSRAQIDSAYNLAFGRPVPPPVMSHEEERD